MKRLNPAYVEAVKCVVNTSSYDMRKTIYFANTRVSHFLRKVRK